MQTDRATPLQDERFLMLENLGRGGMGTVYRAFDRADQRLVALKVPHAPGVAGPAHPLAEEFDRWSRFDHPNIVRAYEMAHAERGPIAPGTPYLVLEHVRGGPAHRLLPPGRDGQAAAEQLAVQVLSALAHLHAAGYVHRDLKPANVLASLTPEGKPFFQITDFGLAARIGSSTVAGTVSGSLPYVAPEALCGLPLDGRTDLYGLGVLLYRVLTGRMPVRNPSLGSILRWHLAGPLPDPSRQRPDLSPRLRRFVRRLLRRNRAERPASAVRALELLGIRQLPGPPRGGLPAAARGTRVTLRLALDAVRLGARRVFRLPPESPTVERLLRELRVWSQVRNLRFHRCRGPLERLVLRLMADRAEPGPELMQRYGLERWMALETLGQVPLPVPARVGTPDDRAAVRAVRDLILDCAGYRPLVLWFDRQRPAPLTHALLEQLVREIEREPRAAGWPGPGGLLLLV